MMQLIHVACNRPLFSSFLFLKSHLFMTFKTQKVFYDEIVKLNNLSKLLLQFLFHNIIFTDLCYDFNETELSLSWTFQRSRLSNYQLFNYFSLTRGKELFFICSSLSLYLNNSTTSEENHSHQGNTDSCSH